MELKTLFFYLFVSTLLKKNKKYKNFMKIIENLCCKGKISWKKEIIWDVYPHMQQWVLWQYYYYYPDIDCQMSEWPLGGSNGVRQLWQLKSKMWQICSFICKSKEAFRIAVLLTQRWNKSKEDYSSGSGKWWNYSVTQALILLSAFSVRIKKMKITS